MAARRILIVEDETMIAMMIEDFLKGLGWDVVGWAAGDGMRSCDGAGRRH